MPLGTSGEAIPFGLSAQVPAQFHTKPIGSMGAVRRRLYSDRGGGRAGTRRQHCILASGSRLHGRLPSTGLRERFYAATLPFPCVGSLQATSDSRFTAKCRHRQHASCALPPRGQAIRLDPKQCLGVQRRCRCSLFLDPGRRSSVCAGDALGKAIGRRWLKGSAGSDFLVY